MNGRKETGFSLIELMIALVIIAILATVAFPSYQAQVSKTRRGDCEAGLLSLSNAMERDYSLNGSYRDIVTAGLFAGQCPVDGSAAATYNLSVATANGGGTYTLTATPIAGTTQAGDACANLTFTQAGVKGASGGTVANCW